MTTKLVIAEASTSCGVLAEEIRNRLSRLPTQKTQKISQQKMTEGDGHELISYLFQDMNKLVHNPGILTTVVERRRFSLITETTSSPNTMNVLVNWIG